MLGLCYLSLSLSLSLYIYINKYTSMMQMHHVFLTDMIYLLHQAHIYISYLITMYGTRQVFSTLSLFTISSFWSTDLLTTATTCGWWPTTNRGHKYTEEKKFLTQNKTLPRNFSNPMHLLCTKISRSVWQCVFIQGFKQSLSCSVSVMPGCEVSCQNINFDSCHACHSWINVKMTTALIDRTAVCLSSISCLGSPL